MTAIEHRGDHGVAALIPLPAGDPRTAATIAYWLLTAPDYHPAWDQFLLACIRVYDTPGQPPTRRQFDGATHEIAVVTMSPDLGPYSAAQLGNWMAAGLALPVLIPANVVEQFEATDEEMRRVCESAAVAVVDGDLCPQADDAPAAVRELWLTRVVRDLAHLRGEAHAP